LKDINFVGELNRRQLLTDSIVLSVFEMLLGFNQTEEHMQNVNDYTIEGAVVLMSRIGHILDGKLSKINKTADSKETEKRTAEKIASTFSRFEELTKDTCVAPETSTRIKMLIKNLLEIREQGWEKVKKAHESGPMKVEDLRKETQRKLLEAEQQRLAAEREEMGYLENTGSGGRGGRHGGGKQQYNTQQTYAPKG
jgi:formyltetrahydrofolate synthetase